MKEKNHILDVLKKTKKALKEKDAVKIKELSNQTIHSASIYQDSEHILIAVILYSLNKIIERKNYQKYEDYSKLFKSFSIHINKAISNLDNNKEEKFREELKKIRQELSKLSGNFRKHIEYVFEKASINKASRIYEHGISIEKTAQLLGITIWELANYAGKTGISEVNLNKTMTAKKRAKMALELFNGR